jgi:hypothetical protein
MATVGNPFIIDVKASGFGAESYPIQETYRRTQA